MQLRPFSGVVVGIGPPHFPAKVQVEGFFFSLNLVVSIMPVLQLLKQLKGPPVRTANENHTVPRVGILDYSFKICPGKVVFEGAGIYMRPGGEHLGGLGLVNAGGAVRG